MEKESQKTHIYFLDINYSVRTGESQNMWLRCIISTASIPTFFLWARFSFRSIDHLLNIYQKHHPVTSILERAQPAKAPLHDRGSSKNLLPVLQQRILVSNIQSTPSLLLCSREAGL